MAQDIVNVNQNLSYTNLDFSSIYTEVLDMVKQLTKNWDPSISDESDPGVVLVKLSALIADKCNYNIDKSILEAFPLSVTQDSNARQLYEQLGYYMSWYRAATVPVTLSWKTTTLDENGTVIAYTIPKFTSITDENETVVYTLIGAEGDNDVVVSDGILYTDSSRNLNMIAYEGIPVQYTFNDRTVITANMVDANNRLYLATAYAFENGVFIKNTTQDNYAEWHRVNNLYEFSYDVYRYKFGYDSAANLCYLEFPDNYAELFGSGIEITYLTFSTDESYADVPPQYLSKFLVPVVVGETEDVTLTSETTKISNPEPATGHAEKEDINSAYTNYKKVVGTFKTLITLRDYLNYIKSKDVDICSNAFVTDRTNDIQSTYKIINKYQDIESLITEVEKTDENLQFVKTADEDISNLKTYYTFSNGSFIPVTNPSVADIKNYYEKQGDDILSAFSLKFYLLQKPIALLAREAYDETFEISTENIDLETVLEDTSHLVHDFKPIEPFDPGVFVPTRDTKVSVDSDGNPNKIYYNYNGYLQRYDPVPVTNLNYRAYNPHNMGLYIKDEYYIRTSDIRWITGTTYYYRKANNVYVDFTSKISDYPNVRPDTFTYVYTEEGTSVVQYSYIYVKVIEYKLTEDTEIDSTVTYYEKRATGYVPAVLPNAYGIYVASSNTDLHAAVTDLEDFKAAVGEVEGTYIATCISVGQNTDDTWNFEFPTLPSVTLSTTELASQYKIVYENTPQLNDTITVVYSELNPAANNLYEQSEEALLPHIVFFKNKYPISMSISTYNSVSNEVRQDILSNIIKAFYDNLDSSNIDFGNAISIDYLTRIVTDSDARIKSVTFEALTYTTYAVYWDDTQNGFVEVKLPSSLSEENMAPIYLSPSYESIIAYLFGKDVICKSILAGTTQLLIPDNIFAYHLNQKFIDQISGIKYITGEAEINMHAQDPYYIIGNSSNPQIRKSYTLQENETVTLFKPLISDVETYTAGVHYDYLIFSDIVKDQSYQLKRGEYFIFYISNLDSDGILQSFNVYVYGQNAVIHPTFDIEKRDELSSYGANIAINLAGANPEDISVDTSVYSYTESRGTQVSQINSEDTINNTKIATNQSISAQKVNIFTVVPEDGYRFIWSLNKPIYDGTLKQYQLFPKYNPEEDIDLENISRDNSYTLKSGEYLYYTDSSLSNLGILGAGTTIFRNCGINSEIRPIVSELPYVMVNWEDLYNSETYLNAQGFSIITTDGNIDPQANGFYVNTGEGYVRTTDTTLDAQQTYYVLLMKEVSGWYVQRGENDYVLATAPTTSVFSLMDTKSEFTDYDVSPAAQGLYEKINYQNVPVTDTYYMPNKGCSSSEEYFDFNVSGKANTVNRFVNSMDTSILTSEFIEDTAGNIVNTLTPIGDIYDDENINPFASGWVKKENNNALIQAVWDDTLFEYTPKNYDGEEGFQVTDYSYYKYSAADSIYHSNYGKSQYAYRQVPVDGGNGKLGFVGALDSLVSIYNANRDKTGEQLVKAVDNAWKAAHAIDDVVSKWRIALFGLTASINGQDWQYYVDNPTWTSSSGTEINILDGIHYAHIQSPENLSALSTLTTPQLLALKNNLTFGVYNYQGSSWTGRAILCVRLTPDILTPEFKSLFDPIEGNNVRICYMSPTTDSSALFSQPILPTENGPEYEKYVTRMDDICSYLPGLQDVFGVIDDGSYTTGIYFMPLWYEMTPWYAYANKEYYMLNTYASKTYAQVDPLVCGAIDSLTLTSNPLSVMRTMFQGVQANTSLTFTQNQLYTLSQGDTITFETANSSAPSIVFPTFTNDEVVLDLDNYDVSYKRVGDNLVTLDKIQVENCSWKGYSNLQLNTNFDNGQKLYSNQSLVLYGDSEELQTVYGNSDSDVHFQLQYPMVNVSGTFIEVTASNLVQENLLNTIYVYNISQGGTDYAYSADNYKTYVYVKRASTDGSYSFNPSGVTLENIRLSTGEYLIPVNGLSNYRIEISYNDNILHCSQPQLSGSSITIPFDEDTFIDILEDNHPEVLTQPQVFKFICTATSPKTWNLTLGSSGTVLESDVDLTDYGIELSSGQTVSVNDFIAIDYSSTVVLLHDYIDTEKSYFLGDKLHFAYLNVTGLDLNRTASLHIQILSPEGEILDLDEDIQITIVLNDIFKFNTNPQLADCFDDIKAKLIALDVNQKYDYTHIPKDDDIIPDPLLSKEFWNKNHVYNTFTIGQWDVDSIEYKFIT